jgi:hypothetical protein
MTFQLRGALAAAALALAPAAGLSAQGLGAPPTAAQCEQWAAGLTAGGQAALDVVTYGNLPACSAVAPAAFASAIRNARPLRDTTYLGRLAGAAGQVRDPAVFGAALEVAGDRRASSESRVMGLLVTVSSLGTSQDVPGYTRPQLFTRALPASGICSFEVAAGGWATDNPLSADAERQAARVLDGIRYANGQPALVQNLARCARSVVSSDIPPQVDAAQIRVDYVCGNTFRLQNHTGANLTLTVTTTAPDGTTETEDVPAPARGGWTQYNAPTPGRIQVTYDGTPVASVANTGRGCGGGS